MNMPLWLLSTMYGAFWFRPHVSRGRRLDRIELGDRAVTYMEYENRGGGVE